MPPVGRPPGLDVAPSPRELAFRAPSGWMRGKGGLVVRWPCAESGGGEAKRAEPPAPDYMEPRGRGVGRRRRPTAATDGGGDGGGGRIVRPGLFFQREGPGSEPGNSLVRPDGNAFGRGLRDTPVSSELTA